MLKFLRSLNQPLVVAVAVALVARLALALGGDPLDPAWAAFSAIVVGLLAGLFTYDTPLAALRALDPKLVSTVVTAGLTWVAVELLDFASDDPLLQALVALVAGAVVGWIWPNLGTMLRTPQETGNAIPPDGRKLEGAPPSQ